jgi:dipeptidyl aminopeptidase/acylaminoacyl peptidase
VEYLRWSPDGTHILLGVAGHGADVAGGQGAVRTSQHGQQVPEWLPSVETGHESHRWRSLWVYDLATDSVRRVDAGINVWEATWCGNDTVALIGSEGPGEGLWYTAHLRRISLSSGEARELYRPNDQLGWVSASPSGARIAVVEAICSDRWLVAGNLKLVDTSAEGIFAVDTHGIDVSYTEWLSESRLLVAGHRGVATVAGVYDVHSNQFEETWQSDEVSSGGFCASIARLGDAGDFLIAAQGFRRFPELGAVRSGEYRTVSAFGSEYSELATNALDAVERLSWRAPDDGLLVEGWLLTPREFDAPHAVVMHVHGGPVYHWRPSVLSALHILLLEQGYALFLPNPRGSSGRGQEFARQVVGDIGGADSRDLIAGIDHLVERGLGDPKRLGVMGGSYGGYMTSWLVTQEKRFAAAVAVAPVTNRTSQRLTANHPQFIDLFVGDGYTNPGGRYFQRSPIMYAQNVRTPTLNICGALDRCTPPKEAVQFHSALRENGVKSVLVTYPEEGHGVRKPPAVIDYSARVATWFEEHLNQSAHK